MIEIRLNGATPPSTILSNALYHATFALDGREIDDVEWTLTGPSLLRQGHGPFDFVPITAAPHTLAYSTLIDGLVVDNTTILNVSLRAGLSEVSVNWDKIQYATGETISGSVVLRDSEGVPPRSVAWVLLCNNVEVARGVTARIAYQSAPFGIYRVIATVVDYHGSQLQNESTVFVSGQFEAAHSICPPQPNPTSVLLGSVYTHELKGSSGSASSLPYQLAAYSQTLYLLPGTTHYTLDIDPGQNQVDDEVVVRTNCGNWVMRGVAGGLTTESVGYDYRPVPPLIPAPFNSLLNLTVDAFNVHGAAYGEFNFRVRVRCYRNYGQPIYQYTQCPYSVYPGGEGKRFRRFAALFSEIEAKLDDGVSISRLGSSEQESFATTDVTTVPLVRLNTSGAPNPVPTDNGIFFTDTNLFASYESPKDSLEDLRMRAVSAVEPYRPFVLSLQMPGLPVIKQTLKRLKGKLAVYVASGALVKGSVVNVTVVTGKSPGQEVFALPVSNTVYNVEDDIFQKVGEVDIDLSDFQFSHTGVIVYFSVDESAVVQDVVLSDGEYNPALNFNSFKQWNVYGNVDLIGAGATANYFDVIPGNGMYVDMAGTPGPGKLETKQTFEMPPGTYALEYKMAHGYAILPIAFSTHVTVGTIFSGTVTMNYHSNPSFVSFRDVFTVGTATTAKLAFESTDTVGFYGGLLLDSIRFKRIYGSSGTNLIDHFPVGGIFGPHTGPNAVATASVEGNPAWVAFNGETGSPPWHTQPGVTQGWIQVEFNTPKVAQSYTLYAGVSLIYTGPAPEEYLAFAPYDWQLQGSQDGASWTTLDTQAGVTGWRYAVGKSFSFANTTAYKFYRLFITAPDPASASLEPGLNEWELFGTPSGDVGLFTEDFDSVVQVGGSLFKPDPAIADESIYTTVYSKSVRFDGACFSNPMLQVMVDSEQSANRAVPLQDCTVPDCGPIGIYCYTSVDPPTQLITIAQPLYYPAPVVAYGTAQSRCFHNPAFVAEIATPVEQNILSYQDTVLCGTAYRYLNCAQSGTIAVVYPYGTSPHGYVAYSGLCYTLGASVTNAGTMTLIGVGSVAPVTGCLDVVCTGSNATGASVGYVDNETGQKVNIRFERLDLGIPRYGAVPEKIDTGLTNQPPGEATLRFNSKARVYIMRALATGRINYTVGLQGFKKKFVVMSGGVERIYPYGQDSTDAIIDVQSGDEVFLDIGNEAGLLSARTRNLRARVSWNPVLVLPRIYDTKTWNFFGTQVIRALAFCGITNRQSYRVFDSIPFDGVSTGILNPDNIVTLLIGSKEYVLIRQRATGEAVPPLPGGTEWYAGQGLSGFGEIQFYTSREYFGAHGEMDMWLTSTGVFPNFFKVSPYTALRRPAGFYRRELQVGDTSRNALRMITSPTGIMLPVVYTALDGEEISVVSNQSTVVQNGKTYYR